MEENGFTRFPSPFLPLRLLSRVDPNSFYFHRTGAEAKGIRECGGCHPVAAEMDLWERLPRNAYPDTDMLL
jgi:hypothetical protein